MTMLALAMVLAGLYMGWNLGANDGANSMGTAVGAGVRTMREAIAIVAIFGFLGAATMGTGVIKTVGEGIVPLNELESHLALRIGLAALFGAGSWLTIATYLGLPVSTTHSVVGAVAGAGLAAGNVVIYWRKLSDIFIAWLATPIGAAVIAYVLYRVMRKILVNRSVSNRVWTWLLTLSGVYMAFSWGANDVANATGVIVGAGFVSPLTAAVFGGLAIALGVATWGYKVMETVGTRIIALAPPMAFIAELSAALNVQVFTILGIPVSSTHAIIGAIFGVGLVHGRAAVNRRTARDIALAWATTPLCAGVVAYVLFWVIRLLFGMGGSGT